MSDRPRQSRSHLLTPRRAWVLVAVAVGWLFVVGARFLLPAVLPQVKTTFGVGNAGAGLAVSVIWGAYAVMQAPGGVLIDRVGERLLLAGSLVLTGAAVVVVAFAPTYVVFLVGCAAFGLTTGLYGPARGTSISRSFPNNDGAAIGATLAAGSIGSAVLPFVAGSLVGEVGWRLLLGVLVVPFVVVAGLAWAAVPDRRGDEDASPPEMRVLVGDVARAVRTPAVARAVAAVTLLLFAFQGITAFLPTYLVEVKGFDQATATGLFALLFVAGAGSQLLAGTVADRIGERWVLTATAAVATASAAALPFVDGLLIAAVVVAAVGTRLAMAPVSNAYVIDILPPGVQGSAWGMLRTGFFLVSAGGSTLVGAFADRGLFDEAFFVLAALAALATLLYARLPSRATAKRQATAAD
ncbi:MFS transporter [Salinigranum marinum]|uniref:MFS transporter n=1 Tax=Salinigranum marinum TaxID=1515595 RepID=UPI002989E1E2|nr:MFS transporter [Salinigranum marinum]